MTTYAAASSGARWLAESRALPERLLSRLWRARTGRRLTATDGRRVEVLYPGRPAPGHGPDFRDAVLAIDGAPVRGDVEVHRSPSGWQAHGHGADASYDRVVLHVVGKDGPGGPSPDTPTVVVGSRPGRPRRSPPPPLLAELASLDDAALRERLRASGEAWFAERSERLAAEAAVRGADQALYEALMDGFGYAENRAPFAELARLLPAALLAAGLRSAPEAGGAELLRRLLLAGAGLAPLNAEWRRYAGMAPMASGAWRTAGVRPQNHPAARIECAAAALAPHLRRGLTASVEATLEHGAATVLSAPGLGAGRARTLLATAVLPMLAAVGNPRIREASRAHFLALPALPANTVTREAWELARSGESLAKARLGATEHLGLQRLYRQAVGRG
ncbi:MAG: DUF2851 family protein [Dehalococcoidia bacterium]|nr:DUF2851 family protein [Dehalococcoidia bacterium]